MLKQDWASLNSKKLPISIMRKIEKNSPSFFYQNMNVFAYQIWPFIL